MKILETVKSGLEEKFQKVLTTPASFDLFVAIHDFIEHIERNASLSRSIVLSMKVKGEADLSKKYGSLKQIYQGLQDTKTESDADLGHTRYAVMLELNRIRNNNVSESNSFWKRREFFRKAVGEVYQRLNPLPA